MVKENILVRLFRQSSDHDFGSNKIDFLEAVHHAASQDKGLLNPAYDLALVALTNDYWPIRLVGRKLAQHVLGQKPDLLDQRLIDLTEDIKSFEKERVLQSSFSDQIIALQKNEFFLDRGASVEFIEDEDLLARVFHANSNSKPSVKASFITAVAYSLLDAKDEIKSSDVLKGDERIDASFNLVMASFRDDSFTVVFEGKVLGVLLVDAFLEKLPISAHDTVTKVFCEENAKGNSIGAPKASELLKHLEVSLSEKRENAFRPQGNSSNQKPKCVFKRYL